MNKIIKNDLFLIRKSLSFILINLIFLIIILFLDMVLKFQMDITSFSDFLEINSKILGYSALLWAVIYFSNYITDEKSNGTIKIYMINPITRNEFIVGKAVTYIITLIIILIISIIFSSIFASIFSGEIDLNNIKSLIINLSLQMFVELGIAMMIMFVSILLSKGSSIIYVTIVICSILFFLIKYLKKFNVLDIMYNLNSLNAKNVDLIQLIVVLIYIIIFGGLSMIIFKKRDLN